MSSPTERAQLEVASVSSPRRVLLVGSSGGHLAQLLALESWWSKHERLWVTFDTVDAVSLLEREEVAWAHHPTTRNLRNLARNLRLARRVIGEFRPDLVVSTGAGVALPFFLSAWMKRIPRAYVEVYDRLDSRTLTGRLCRPITNLFMVQWPEQAVLYPGAPVIGRLL